MKSVIVVRYESDELLFISKIKSILSKYSVYVYDNSKVGLDVNLDGLYYFHDSSNSGLAVAINHCVRHAVEDGVKLCIYFDQDSSIDIELVDSLFESYSNLKFIDPTLCFLGPQPVMSDGTLYPVKVNQNFKDNYYDATEIITSGMTFIPHDVADLDFFDEDLFLDMVDFEICWRAKSQGKKVCIDRSILMMHEVGEKSITLPFRSVPISSPKRNYYQIRNMLYLALYKNNKGSLIVMYYLARRILNILINMVFADQRLIRLKYNYCGIRDAFKKRMGKLEI